MVGSCDTNKSSAWSVEGEWFRALIIIYSQITPEQISIVAFSLIHFAIDRTFVYYQNKNTVNIFYMNRGGATLWEIFTYFWFAEKVYPHY